jgi:hypothetical protein
MQPSTFLPAALLAFSTPAAADCSNTNNSHVCPGSIYGTASASSSDISQLIRCRGSSSCGIITDGSITKCDSGTRVALSNARNSGVGGLSVSGRWMVIVVVVVVLVAGVFAFV